MVETSASTAFDSGDPTLAAWDRSDLIRRVQQSLDIAGSALTAAERTADPDALDRELAQIREKGFVVPDVLPFVMTKLVAESTMLLRSAASVGRTVPAIATAIDALARRLEPHARGEFVSTAICREPTSAIAHAAAHIHLRDLGYSHPGMDRLLAETLDGDDVGGPELRPMESLEREWLAQIRSGVAGDAVANADILSHSCLAHPLNALASATLDLYAFTHVVLYVSDMGRRRSQLPRTPELIAADAEAGLAAALDADNYDLAAELIWTWPMLGLPWSPAATFGFLVLTMLQDEHGFLPGPGWSARVSAELSPDVRDEYRLRTSYHATLVMGFLCAAAIPSGLTPPTSVTSTTSSRALIDMIAALLRDDSRERAWLRTFRDLSREARESLAEFVLTIGLRRARSANDLQLVREAVTVALRCDLVDGPAVHQAVALLRRATLLGQPAITQRA